MKTHRRNSTNVLMLSAFACCLSGAVFAETGVAEMHVVSMPLSDVVSWYSEHTGQIVVLPEGMSVRVSNVRLRATTDDFKDWLRRDFDLDYFLLGNTLYLSPSSQSIRHMLPLDGVALYDLVAGVAALDARAASPLSPGNQDDTSVLIVGPPDYVALVETVLEDLKADRSMRGRIVVNRGGQLIVDDISKRRSIVGIAPETAAPVEKQN